MALIKDNMTFRPGDSRVPGTVKPKINPGATPSPSIGYIPIDQYTDTGTGGNIHGGGGGSFATPDSGKSTTHTSSSGNIHGGGGGSFATPDSGKSTTGGGVITATPTVTTGKEIADITKTTTETNKNKGGAGTGTGTGTGIGTGTGTSTPPIAPPTEAPDFGGGKITELETQTNKMIADLTEMINQQNEYMVKLSEMKFDYDASTDPAFLKDAANLENAVTQMMVGRGGMYSSVAQSALQSRLSALQIDYRDMKYSQFKEERAFTMDLAQMEQDRRGKLFNQMLDLNNVRMNQEKWRVEQEQIKWENQWKQYQYEQEAYDRDLRRQWEIEDRQRRIAEANALHKANVAAAYTSKMLGEAEMRATEFTFQKKSFDKAMAEWKASGTANLGVSQVFARLGISVPYGANYYNYSHQIQQAGNKIYSMQETVQNEMFELGMNAEYLNMINTLLIAPDEKQTKTGEFRETEYERDIDGNILRDDRNNPIPLGTRTTYLYDTPGSSSGSTGTTPGSSTPSGSGQKTPTTNKRMIK